MLLFPNRDVDFGEPQLPTDGLDSATSASFGFLKDLVSFGILDQMFFGFEFDLGVLLVRPDAGTLEIFEVGGVEQGVEIDWGRQRDGDGVVADADVFVGDAVEAEPGTDCTFAYQHQLVFANHFHVEVFLKKLVDVAFRCPVVFYVVQHEFVVEADIGIFDGGSDSGDHDVGGVDFRVEVEPLGNGFRQVGRAGTAVGYLDYDEGGDKDHKDDGDAFESFQPWVSFAFWGVTCRVLQGLPIGEGTERRVGRLAFFVEKLNPHFGRGESNGENALV